MQPNVYEISDPESGKTYRIEADEGVTEEEALAEFESLEPDQRASFEFNTTDKTQDQEVDFSVPEQQGSAPVSVSTGDSDGYTDVTNDPMHQQAVQRANTKPAPKFSYEEAINWAESVVPQDSKDYALGIDQIGRESKDMSPEFVDRDEKLFLSLANNPRVKVEDLNKFLTSRGKLPFTKDRLDEIRKNREEGTPYGSLDYENPAEELLGGPFIPVEDPDLGKIGAGLEAGMAENPMGVAWRGIQDLLDLDVGGISDEMLEQRYPGITEEGKEQIRDLLLGELRRRELGNAYYQLEAKDVGALTQFGTGLVGGASPIDLIPLGRGATFGKRASEAFFFNQAADAIMQGQDIAYGAQEEFDPVRSAMAGVTGVALQGAIEAPLSIATKLGFASRLDRPDGRLPTPLEPLDQTIPQRTTTNKKSKAYAAETKQAVEATQARAEDIASRWSNPPKIQAVDSFRDIAGLDSDALGVYRSDGTLMINTDAILNFSRRRNLVPDDVVRTVMFHEGLGHHGLASKYGDALEAIMNDIYTNGDIAVRLRADSWMDRYGVDDPALAMEEVLAEMAEQGELPTSIIQRLYTMIKNFARQIGFSPKYTTSELRSILSVSQQETIKGAPREGGGFSDKYMRLWHGSPYDFAGFDHSYMGTGEGYQAFGWGTYLTDDRNLAETNYRDRLSERTTVWNGIEHANAYSMRRTAMDDLGRMVDPEDPFAGQYFDAADFAITSKMNDGDMPYESARDFFDDSSGSWPDGKWTQEASDAFAKGFQPLYDAIDQKLSFTTKGKLYEVDVPDNSEFLEWEEPLSKQSKLKEVLEDSGFHVVDYNTWNDVNRKAYEARLKYTTLNNRLEGVDELTRDKVDIDGNPIPEEELAQLEKIADDLFIELQEASIERNKAINTAKKYVHEDMPGEGIYSALTENLGSPKEASLLLDSYGIKGTRYLANNMRKKASRANDGTDRFNYVIFNDKTPKIVNKYMRPYQYEEGKGPIDPNLLDAQELFEAENAFEILDEIVPKGVRPTMSMEELEADAIARKMPPSALLRLVEKDPGYLARSLFMHDIALTKAGERVATLLAKINSGNYTVDDKANFLKTFASYEELTERIFGMGSEFGLALRAMQNITHTRRNLTSIRDALKDVGGAEGLAALDDPATFEKLARDFGGQLIEASEKVKRQENPFISALNLPRALMSSMDLSAPLRQGLFFIGRKEYNNAFLEMHKLFAKDSEYYDALMYNIQNRDTYGAMMEAKLAFSSVDENTPLSAREEDFQTSLANDVPGVARSNRAFSGFRNQLSADMFDHYFKVAQDAGANVGQLVPDPETGKLRWTGDEEAKTNLERIGALVNAGTGRGNIPLESLRAAGPLLNAAFFSPRLFFSRLHLLNPATYYRLPPGVRKEVVARAASVGSGYILALSALAMAYPEADIETDPRKSDFGKVRVGNTRFDVLGGFGQYITLGARLATGQKVSSTGRVSNITTAPFIRDLHEGFRDMLIYSGVGSAEGYRAAPETQYDRDSVIGAFLQNKLSPNASYFWDMFVDGENFKGEPFDPVDEALARVVPLYFQDMADLYSEEGPKDPVVRALGTIGGLYGIGSNTYVPKSLNPNQKLDPPETMKDKNLEDGENEWVIVENGTITLKPEALEIYDNRLNLYFTEIMDYEMSQRDWEELDPKTQAEIIKEARNEARREARKDMRKLFGID